MLAASTLLASDRSDTETNLLMNPPLLATVAVSFTGGVAGGTKLDRIKIKIAIKYGRIIGMAMRKPSRDFFLRSCLTMVASLKLTRRVVVCEPISELLLDDNRLLLRRLMIPFGRGVSADGLGCDDGGERSLRGL